MTTSPKSRIQVTGNLAAIARTRKMEPVASDDPAIAFMPPLASVEELSSSGAAPRSESDGGVPKVDVRPSAKVKFPAASPPAEPLPTRGAQAQQRNDARRPSRRQETTSQRAPVNKAESADYTRVTLRLPNEVITRLVTHGLSRNKRYTTVIEDFIMAGLDRHKD